MTDDKVSRHFMFTFGDVHFSLAYLCSIKDLPSVNVNHSIDTIGSSTTYDKLTITVERNDI